MKRKSLFTVIIVMLLGSASLFAQTPGGGLEDDPDATQAPIDGGVSLLIAAGVAYGAKKAHEHRKKLQAHKVD